ncbi:NYN domain-containing protein [Sinorhizobium meliloti]|uniref:NYN domain-containing protein n=1 Tax=Rhizobium meliloti TaxID=382 RepID=UPI001F2FC5D0|nr:NYN domain-containing protein [Sinorhizobium meliloti]
MASDTLALLIDGDNASLKIVTGLLAEIANYGAKAVTASADENGRANLAGVGAHLAKQAPDFDARNYGFARLSDLVAASGLVDMESTGDHPKIIMVKLKAAPAPK